MFAASERKSLAQRHAHPLWQSIHDDLMRSALRQESRFADLARECPSLECFASPMSVLMFVHSPSEDDAARKNAIYIELVRAARAETSASKLARDLIWLGLWPALDRILSRQRKKRSDVEDVIMQLASAFTDQLAEIDPLTVRSVAAHLVLGTIRTFAEAALNHCREKLAHAELRAEPVQPLRAPGAEDSLDLQRDLGHQEIPDLDLFIDRIAFGYSLGEMARYTGQTEGAIRKRVERVADLLHAKNF